MPRSPWQPFAPENLPTEQHGRASLRCSLESIQSSSRRSFEIDVTSALVRAGAAIAVVSEYLGRDLAARELITLGPRAARAISGVAARTRLRAADAAYVWVASSRGLPLVTLDREIAQKIGTLCQVEEP